MIRRNEKGFVAIEFVAGVALLMVPTALLVLTFPTWSERQEMTRVAAREAARTYVLTSDANQAEAVVQQISNNYSLPEDDLEVTLAGDPTERGSRVSATVTGHAPVFNLPIWNIEMGNFDIKSTHTESVDLFRAVPEE